MFTPQERDQIQLKAMEQALRAADLAKTEPDPLLPTCDTWPFRLSADERVFLKINKISPA